MAVEERAAWPNRGRIVIAHRKAKMGKQVSRYVVIEVLAVVLSVLAVSPACAEEAVATALNPPSLRRQSRVSSGIDAERGLWGMASRDGSIRSRTARPASSWAASLSAFRSRPRVPPSAKRAATSWGITCGSRLRSRTLLLWRNLHGRRPFGRMRLTRGFRCRPVLNPARRVLCRASRSSRLSKNRRFNLGPNGTVGVLLRLRPPGRTKGHAVFRRRAGKLFFAPTLMVHESASRTVSSLGWLSWAGSNPSVSDGNQSTRADKSIGAMFLLPDGLDGAVSEPLPREASEPASRCARAIMPRRCAWPTIRPSADTVWAGSPGIVAPGHEEEFVSATQKVVEAVSSVRSRHDAGRTTEGIPNVVGPLGRNEPSHTA